MFALSVCGKHISSKTKFFDLVILALTFDLLLENFATAKGKGVSQNVFVVLQFSQNYKIKRQLFETFPKVLVEASPFDKIWGIGLAKGDCEAWNQDKWRGKNLLGFIITEVRDELMNEAGKLKSEDKMVSTILCRF